jgi:hypothetical protein
MMLGLNGKYTDLDQEVRLSRIPLTLVPISGGRAQ